MSVQNFPNVPNSTLPHVDYRDVFAVELPPAVQLDAEGWTRLVFRPESARDALLLAGIGLGLGATRPVPAAAGIGAFNVVDTNEERVVLETLTRVGLVGIVVAKEASQLVLTTFIAFRGPLSRAVFERAVKHGHQRAVPYVLGRAVEKAAGRVPQPRPRWIA